MPDGGYAESTNAGGIENQFCCASGRAMVGSGGTDASRALVEAQRRDPSFRIRDVAELLCAA
jgi:hypothetical protein